MMPPCPMPGALMIAGWAFPWTVVWPTAHVFPAGSAPMAVSCSGFSAGVTCAVAPARLSRKTPVWEVASTFDPAAATPDSPVPPPAGAAVQAVPFHSAAYEPVQVPPSPQENSTFPTAHSPAALAASPVRTTKSCAGAGGTGSLVQAVPSNCATWSPPAIQTRPGATATASREPRSGTLTCCQALPFQCSTSDAPGYLSPPTAHTSFAARAATAASWLGSAGPAGSGVGLRV